MGRYQICLRVLHLLPLIAIFQIPTAFSFPFQAPSHGSHRPPKDWHPEQPPVVPYVSRSSVYEYIPSQHLAEHTSHRCPPPAYVVGNGRVRAGCTKSRPISSASTSHGTSATSHYTPVPRQDTTSWAGTSTTTVDVPPSPSPSGSTSGVPTLRTLPGSASTTSQSEITTTLPDSALTSLTTSEVQTLTAAPFTNTSGVS